MFLRSIANAAFIPLAEAFTGLANDYIEMQKESPRGFLKHNVVEKCYNSIVGFFSLYDWFIHDVGFNYISHNSNLTDQQKLTLTGFKSSNNPEQKPTYEKTDDSSKKIVNIISQFEITDVKARVELFNVFCSEKTKLKPFQSMRNKLVHGSSFEVGDEFILDDDVDVKEYYKDLAPKYGLSYNELKTAPLNMEFLSINVNLTVDTAYELSKQTIKTLKCFWEACYRDKILNQLDRLDYVCLISSCDVTIPQLLRKKLENDFSESFTQSPPPSSSQ